MKKIILILLIAIASVSSVFSTPDAEYLNPLDHAEDMPYRWCVKHEKNSFSRKIFKNFLDVKNYMRENDLAYVFIQDCFVDENEFMVKYKRLTRIWKKDNIHGRVYDNSFTNTKD